MDENEKNCTQKDAAEKTETGKLTLKQAKDIIAELTQKNEELKAQADDFKDKWMRTAAEFENYKKRTLSTRAQALADGKADVLLKLFPIGDNLDRAMLTADESTKKGLELVLRSFRELLEKEGIEEINPVGEKFDPNLHEALMQAEAENGEESGNVKDVFLKGYKTADKVIRYAQVRVIQ